jgi:hypothetical protein
MGKDNATGGQELPREGELEILWFSWNIDGGGRSRRSNYTRCDRV